MRERINETARAAIRWIGGAIAGSAQAIIDWIRGDDVTVLVVLGVVALVILFVVVPAHRRY